MNKIIDIAPLIIFVALILVLLTFLSEKEDQLESVLIDSTFPEFSIASLKDPKENLSKKDISELPALINVWATWCIACRIEHPFLMDLKKNSVLKIYGLNYKDEREDAIIWLKKYGNPYQKILHDYKGNLALDLGVTGAPETFLINDGKVVAHYQGEVNDQIWNDVFLPIIEERKMF